mmetsp:Transcript_52079/g.153701  ORF Transcript_52079/g.153701 Transcript_52079/m.153701 type:complete len:115 (+) Transcript_52079:320-664(+)|eukprot:4654973-Prymnesium_polylepis.1
MLERDGRLFDGGDGLALGLGPEPRAAPARSSALVLRVSVLNRNDRRLVLGAAAAGPSAWTAVWESAAKNRLNDPRLCPAAGSIPPEPPERRPLGDGPGESTPTKFMVDPVPVLV